MKTFLLRYCTCAMLSLLFFALKGTAQTAQPPGQPPASNTRVSRGADGSLYTYTLFIAPNKVYGYNIFRMVKSFIISLLRLSLPATNSQPLLTKCRRTKQPLLPSKKLKEACRPS